MAVFRVILIALALVVGLVSCVKCADDECTNGDVAALLQAKVVAHTMDFAGKDVDAGDHELLYPYDILKCPKTPEPPLTTLHMEPADYDAVITAYKTVFDELPKDCEGMYCPVADVCGCILRFAGHDFMDFKDGVGGSDACTDMNEPDNAGLDECLEKGLEGTTVKQVYEQFCDKISLADFVVLSAEAAMIYTRQIYLDATSQDRGLVDFKTPFQYGRTTSKTCHDNQMLPDPSKSCRDVERVFVNNMGLDWRLSAALMGVHTLGRAQLKNSGFQGWWSDVKNSRRFNNNYYVSLYLKGWIPEKVESGKWQWGYSDANRNDAVDGKQMMLDSDFCLAWSDKFSTAGYKEVLASSRPKSCAWTIPNLSYEPSKPNKPGTGQYPLFDAMTKYNDGKFCGVVLEDYMRALPGGEGLEDRMAQWRPTAWYQTQYGKRAMDAFAEIRALCCNGCKTFTGRIGEKCVALNKAANFPKVKKDTGVVSHPTGMAKQYVMEFANDEQVWISAFLQAWGVATTNGFVDLKPLTPIPSTPAPTKAFKCASWCLDMTMYKGHSRCEGHKCGACTQCQEPAPPPTAPPPTPLEEDMNRFACFKPLVPDAETNPDERKSFIETLEQELVQTWGENHYGDVCDAMLRTASEVPYEVDQDQFQEALNKCDCDSEEEIVEAEFLEYLDEPCND